MFKIIFKYSLLFLLLFLMPVGLSAQKKQLSQAKDYIKSGKNLDKDCSCRLCRKRQP